MKRNLAIDIARTLCIVEIVGWCHIGYYIGIESSITPLLTGGALSTFYFLSGYFLGKKDIKPLAFYKKRFIRFWPLYFVSCSAMYIGGGSIESFQQLLYAVTGVSVFILPQPLTLWFMAVLMVFYLITPLLISISPFNTKNRWIPILVKGIVFELILVCISLIHPIDIRAIVYFPFYLFGMLLSFDKFDYFFKNSFKIIIVDIVAVLILVHFHLNDFFYGFVSNLLVAIGILALSHLLKKQVEISKRAITFFNWLSYSSLCTYLFHRHIYKLFQICLADDNGTVPLIAAPFMVVSAFFISGIIQRIYDKITCKIKM